MASKCRIGLAKFTVDYWSYLIGWAVIAIDVTVVVAYFLGAGHTKHPEDPV